MPVKQFLQDSFIFTQLDEERCFVESTATSPDVALVSLRQSYQRVSVRTQPESTRLIPHVRRKIVGDGRLRELEQAAAFRSPLVPIITLVGHKPHVNSHK